MSNSFFDFEFPAVFCYQFSFDFFSAWQNITLDSGASFIQQRFNSEEIAERTEQDLWAGKFEKIL